MKNHYAVLCGIYIFASICQFSCFVTNLLEADVKMALVWAILCIGFSFTAGNLFEKSIQFKKRKDFYEKLDKEIDRQINMLWTELKNTPEPFEEFNQTMDVPFPEVKNYKDES